MTQASLFGPTLAEARADFEAKLDDGARCPCCERYSQRYRRTIHSGMARFMVWLVRTTHCQGVKWQDVRAAPERGGDYAKLQNWRLIEPHPEAACTFRPTDAGVAFVLHDLQVPRFAVTLSGVCERLDGEPIGITECLGKRFDLARLLAGEEPEPLRKTHRRLERD